MLHGHSATYWFKNYQNWLKNKEVILCAKSKELFFCRFQHKNRDVSVQIKLKTKPTNTSHLSSFSPLSTSSTLLVFFASNQAYCVQRTIRPIMLTKYSVKHRCNMPLKMQTKTTRARDSSACNR
jgi:hypothetical protein